MYEDSTSDAKGGGEMQPWDVPGLIQRERRRASQTLRGPTFAQLLAGVRTTE